MASVEEAAQEPLLPSLLAELRAYGIGYLTDGARVRAALPFPPAAFLRHLAQSPEPRVRDAVIGLLLLHPELAPAVAATVEEARSSGEARAAEQLITLLLATLYLQRKWLALLALLLALTMGHAPRVPEERFSAYWRERNLPAPWRDFGELGLHCLAVWERRRTASSANYESDWQNQVDRLVVQEMARRPDSPSSSNAPPPGSPAWRPEEAGEAVDETATDAEVRAMSMRPNVTRAEIEQFLVDLGRMVRQPGRVYLAGGAALVHGQFRGYGASTVAIDLKLDVADEQEVENAIRQLKVQSGINVELASPADFIPLPPSWERMSRYVGRYGPLEVFYFDFTTLALAKIDRGSSRDLNDVALLKQQGAIQRDELEAAFQAILPQLGRGRFFNIDPALLARKVAAIVSQLWGPTP